MAAALQLTQALAQCSITCSGARGSCQVRSSKEATFTASAAATSSRSPLSSSLWGGSVPGSRKVKGSTDFAGKRLVRSVSAVYLDDDYEETEEEVRAGYEALYGKPFGQSNAKKRESFEDKDGEGDDEASGGRARRGGEKSSGRREDRGAGGGGRGARSDFEERVVQIRRVTKVVKGGKQLSFRAVVIVGDKKGKVGVGVNKAKEVITAVQKAALNAKRNMVTVPMTKYKTFPHRADGYYGAAHVMLRPAAVGTGVIAGGAVRVVLELAGYENALGKQIRAENPLNNARAVVEAVTGMKTFRQVSADRGIPMEELWK